MYRFYSKPDENNVRVSVVGEFDQEDQIFNVAVARCSSKDSFMRKKGRLIAEGRLSAGKFIESIISSKKPNSDEWISIARGVAKSVAANPELIH